MAHLNAEIILVVNLNQFNVQSHFRDKDGDRNPRRYEGRGEREPISNATLAATTRMISPLKMGSAASNFNVSLIMQGKVTRQCP